MYAFILYIFHDIDLLPVNDDDGDDNGKEEEGWISGISTTGM
jgi:hypothetical protein